MSNGLGDQKYLYQRLGLQRPGAVDPLPEDTIPQEAPITPTKSGFLYERLGLKPIQEPLSPTEIYNQALEGQHEVEGTYKNMSGWEGVLSDNRIDQDIYNSEWQMIKQGAEAGNQQAMMMKEALEEDMKRRASFGEGAKYVGKRIFSIIPFMEADWEKHRVTPLQAAMVSDPDSPHYSPATRGLAVPGGGGLRMGIRDVADMATVIGEFAVIGGATLTPFQVAMQAKKGGKLTSGIIRLMAKSPKWKKVITSVAKSNLDFQIYNLSSVHPEDTKEGATLKTKLIDRVKSIPKTMLDATLFGSLGSFEQTWAQYGGVFTAGYTTTILEALKHGETPAAAHAQAMKSGFLLVGAHGANVLGTKSTQFFQEYGKARGLSEASIKDMASLIVQKRVKDDPIWSSKTQKLAKVQIVGEKKVRGKDSFVLQDVGNEKNTTTISKDKFYENYDKTTHPKEADGIRTKRLGLLHKVQRALKMSDKDVHDIKREIFGVKDKASDAKAGELPHYIELNNKTKTELEVIAREYGLKPSKNMKNAELIELIESSVPRAKGKRLSWADASPEQLYRAYEKLDTRLQVRKVKEDIKHGLHTELLDKDGNKVYVKKTWFGGEPIASVTNAERIVKAFTGEIKVGQFVAENMVKQLNDIVYKNNLKEENFKRIAYAKFEKIDIKDLSKAELEMLDVYNKNMEQGAQFGLENGIFDQIVENYMTGLYPNMSQNSILKTLGRGKKVTGETVYSKEKLHESPVAAEEAGLTPIYDMRMLVGKWWSAAHKAVAQQRLAQRLMDLPAIDGNPALSSSHVSGYIAIKDMPILSKMMTGSRNKTLYIHPALETQFKLLMKSSTPPKGFVKAAHTFNNFVKRIIMVNPLIHGWNIYSDVMDEYNLRMLKSGRVVLFGEKDWLLLKRAGFVKNKKEFKNLSRVEQGELLTKLEMEMAEAGIDLATTTSVTSDLVQSAGRTFSEISPTNATLKQRFQQLGGRVSQTHGAWGKAKAIGRSMKLGSDTLLWDKWVRNSQVAIYSLLKSRAMKHGLDAESAKRVAGHYTKDLLGMLDKEIFSPDGPMKGEALNFMLFARNWTVSNMRLVSGSLGYRGSNLPRFLAHKGLNKGEMKFLQEQYATHIIKGMIAMLAMTNVGNYFITGTEVDKDSDGKFKGFKFNKGKAKWSTSNEEGHELDFDSGMLDNKGRKIYVTPPIFRYLRDYYGWFGEPARTLWNKAHPVGKSMFELLINMSMWNKQQIVSYPEQKTFIQRGSERAKYLIHSVTPYGQFAGRPDEVRNWVEKVIPWFGTWIRHGVGGGDFAMDINEVLREKSYKRDEIDKEIDLMSQTGDPIGVMQRLIETGRYTTLEGIERRLLKYQNPLLYKYLLLSKADQANLLSKYGPKEKEKFFKALTAGDSTVAIPK